MGRMKAMVKLKPKNPTIQPSSGSFGKRTKVSKVYKQLDLSLGPVGSPTIGKTRRKSNVKKNTVEQNKQRLRFRQCDCLYRLLKLIPDIIISWWEKEVPEELQKQGIRSVFMKQCLLFNLEKLLKDYMGLEIEPITIEEREEEIKIRTKLKLQKELMFKEDFYLPNPYRYAGR
jgi:ABC-type Fe3+-hydroxamate transport system substrate-binding protein